ncbi:MAG: hypothetical protein ACYSW2_07815 [Planctomycetota bacterium]|jgi:hypothetical protein
MKTPTFPRRRIAVLLTCLVLCATGCANKQQTTAGDISAVKGQGGIGPDGLTADEIQSQIMGFSDTYSAYIRQAVAHVMTGEVTPEQRANAHRALLNSIYGAITIASSPNSLIAVMDMAVLVTLERMVVEEHFLPLHGDQMSHVLEFLQTAEAEIWELAGQVLWPEQVQELRDIIVQWRADHPDQIIINTVRLSELSQYRRQVREDPGKQRKSVFSFLYVDPLANLDPTMREIQRTRELTERVFFYSERLPVIVYWMARSLYYDRAAATEMQELMSNATQVAGVTERFATAVEGLPDVIEQQREAAVTQFSENLAVERERAIDQFMAGLTDQRQALKEDLAAEEERLQGALSEMKQTINAGTELSSSLDTTIASLDRFVARFERDPGEPKGEPFDINDYRQTAIELAEAARQIDELVASVDQLLITATPGEDEASYVTAVERLETSGARLIDLAFKRGLVIAAVLVVGAGVVVLVGRLVPRSAPR